MDIQKEREAFEKWYRKNYDNSVIDDSEFSEILNEYESNYYWVDELNQSWKAWQEAKAHEAEKLKGCVVVPKTIPENVVERLKNSSYHWGENTKDYFSPIYKMMVEEAARGGNE